MRAEIFKHHEQVEQNATKRAKVIVKKEHDKRTPYYQPERYEGETAKYSQEGP